MDLAIAPDFHVDAKRPIRKTSSFEHPVEAIKSLQLVVYWAAIKLSADAWVFDVYHEH